MAQLRFQVKMKGIFVKFSSLVSLFLLLYLNCHRHPPSSIRQPSSLPDRLSTNHRLCHRHQLSSVLSTVVFVLVTNNRSDMQTGPTTVHIFKFRFVLSATTTVMSCATTAYLNSDPSPMNRFEWLYENTVREIADEI